MLYIIYKTESLTYIGCIVIYVTEYRDYILFFRLCIHIHTHIYLLCVVISGVQYILGCGSLGSDWARAQSPPPSDPRQGYLEKAGILGKSEAGSEWGRRGRGEAAANLTRAPPVPPTLPRAMRSGVTGLRG